MLKELIKNRAYELGADLVGFGNVERCKHAPIMMSPQGLMPGAKTVVVMALHHPDACIELGGEQHPQEIGPYSIQYLMNSRLDMMAYQLATFIEDQGYAAIPIASSNIWRYNTYKELDAVFAPDLSHIYMPVVAGLADMGFNGLALTPEYGSRNRFITVVIDAEVEPDPLIPPGTLCDQCMLCQKHCPSAALTKEIDGEKVLRIEDYEYRFPNKNLWRCAWGEHFDLDLDLEIPEKVTEEVILDAVKTHGLRCGEMGQCLKYCLPKHRRSFDRSYSSTPLRKVAISVDEEMESRALVDARLATAAAKGADRVLVLSAEELRARGIDLEEHLPGAQSAVTVCLEQQLNARDEHADECRSMFDLAAGYQADSICYDLARAWDEMGFRSVVSIHSSASHREAVDVPNLSGQILDSLGIATDGMRAANTVVTRKKMASRLPSRIDPAPRRVSADEQLQALRDAARSFGADLFGIAPVERFEEIAGQIRPHFDGQKAWSVEDRALPFSTFDPEISEETRRVCLPEEYLPGARSVIVLGFRYHHETVRQATRPPAEAVGPYAYQTYVTQWTAALAAVRLTGCLERLGYRATYTADLMKTGSWIANPRGPQQDLFGNRFAALAAGLGKLGLNGHVVTPRFGIRQRFIAIVTDAELPASPLPADGTETLRCSDCRLCVTVCPSQAFGAEPVDLQLGDATHSWLPVDWKRCDWSKRYGLLSASGWGFLGSPTDEQPDEDVSRESLYNALGMVDPIKKYRPAIAEPCVLQCPYGGEPVSA